MVIIDKLFQCQFKQHGFVRSEENCYTNQSILTINGSKTGAKGERHGLKGRLALHGRTILTNAEVPMCRGRRSIVGWQQQAVTENDEAMFELTLHKLVYDNQNSPVKAIQGVL